MKILDVIKRIFIEKHCLACGSPVSYNVDEPFCEQCADNWRRFKNARCHMCGRERELCACLPKYARQVNHSIVGWCVFYNAFENGIINLMFKHLKSVYDKQVIDFCTDWMMRSILVTAKSRGIDLSAYTVTYAPRSLTGVKKYGFDQSRLLALSLAKKLGLPFRVTLKNIGKCEQKGLNKRQRAKNAACSYEYVGGEASRGERFLLVDDIMTTGATMYACAMQLYKNGAQSVVPLVFAKDNYAIKGDRKNVKRNSKHHFTGAFKGVVRNGSQ